MTNESVIRSPKWMRNFLDFEINTGEDIKGEPSESRKRKLEEDRFKKMAEENLKNRKKAEADRKKAEKNKEKEAMEIFDTIKSYIYNKFANCEIN